MSYDAARNSVTVTPRDLTVTADNLAKTYGETVNFTGTEFTQSGLQGDDAITISSTSVGAVDTANVAFMISNQVQQRNLVQVDLILGIITLPMWTVV